MFRLILAAAALWMPLTVSAHSFGRLYTLPVPLWLYNWAATGALLLSFVVVGFFLGRDERLVTYRHWELTENLIGRMLTHRFLLAVASVISLGLFLLCIATGLFGTHNAYQNFNMTFFWIVFLLGFTYFTAAVGGYYERLNPWRSLAGLLFRPTRLSMTGRYTYPQKLGCWPALLFYIFFIWLELFGGSSPRALAWGLLIYSAVNLLGIWLIGSRDWFRYGEFFSVLFRLLSKMAPLRYVPRKLEEKFEGQFEGEDDKNGQGKLVLQAPFIGLTRGQASSMSEVLFVLFILSSTAFDGLHQTEFWMRLFWEDLAGLLQPWTGTNIVQAYPLLSTVYQVWQTIWLVLSSGVYLLVYLFFLWLVIKITRCEYSLRDLALRFAYSLLPIALVYHVTHYYTLILTQGSRITRLASDPFGWGWNLFGTAELPPELIIPDMNWVWHTQVGLILLGHIVSVYLAHIEALRLFPNRRDAIVSQIPMLILMVAFTCIGLWILAQPISAT